MNLKKNTFEDVLRKKFSIEEYVRFIREELIYWAAFLEEKDGFRLGVRFTLKLLMEILLPEEQS